MKGLGVLGNIFPFYVAAIAINSNWISKQYFPIETMTICKYQMDFNFSTNVKDNRPLIKIIT